MANFAPPPGLNDDRCPRCVRCAFVKGQSFSQRVKPVAIDLYEEYENSGIHCLLVESAEQLTLWRELDIDWNSPDSAKTGAIDLTAYAQKILQKQSGQTMQLEMQQLEMQQLEMQQLEMQQLEMQTPAAQEISEPTQPIAQPAPKVQIRYRGTAADLPAQTPDPANQTSTHPQPGRRTYRGSSY